MTKFLFLFLSVFFLACTDGPLPYELSSQWTDRESQDIIFAAEKWNTVTNKRKLLMGDGGYVVNVMTPRDPVHAGWCHTNPEEIDINPGLSDTDLYRVALHEFGHALGMEHIQGFGVMRSDGPTGEFTEGDLIECRRVGAC